MSKLDFIQIGANIGNNEDFIGKKILNKEVSSGILIEPNPKAFNVLKEKFKDNKDFYLEQVAISNYNGKTILNIDRFENDNFFSHIASTVENFTQSHPFAGSSIITKIEVNCETLCNLWDRYSLEHVKYLCIDTEGNDYNILINTNFSKLNIDIIHFEHAHTDGMGVVGQNYYALKEFLKNQGYINLEQIGGDTIASKLNI